MKTISNSILTLVIFLIIGLIIHDRHMEDEIGWVRHDLQQMNPTYRVYYEYQVIGHDTIPVDTIYDPAPDLLINK